jgi:xanthine dehydrogenase accessory factor
MVDMALNTKREMKLEVLIKGGGEMASAVTHKLARSGFRVCLTELPSPQAVHRGTSFCEAVYEVEKEVEGIVAKLISSPEGVFGVWKEGKVPIIVDPDAAIKDSLHPDIVVDAIMAKRNIGTKIADARLVIGLGPGFKVGTDAHLIVETNNSENLGKVLATGEAEKDTGIPLAISGLTFERVLRSPDDGEFRQVKKMGDLVEGGSVVARVNHQPVTAQIGGVIRALLRDRAEVELGTKLGEIDPRGDPQLCYTIRPRARTIAGGVLEAIIMYYSR